MRKSLAVLAAVGLVATMAVAFAGPAGAKGSPGGGNKPPPKEKKCSAKTSSKGITFAFTQFLVAPAAADKVKYVDNGAVLAQVVQQSAAAAAALGLTKPTQDTIPVSVKVQCTGKTAANFTFDLQFKDKTTGTTAAPLGLHQAGDAILKGGTWFISASTVCDLTELEAAQYGTACFQAAGLPVPPPAS